MGDVSSAEYERLLSPQMNVLKRYLYQKVANHADAEDILQDVLLSAYQNYGQLKNKEAVKNWILGIAAHKCADYYRA